MNNGSSIVHMHEVCKTFGKIRAMDHVNLDISRGAIIGLLGANGAGKSTLLRHMIGLYLADQGECITFGKEAAKLGPKELGRIGYVHQEGELLDWMTVGQLIRYVSVYYPNWNRELEEQYIRDFEISVAERVGTLSPGQRQKVAILLAIGFEPELLILDEPASALDPLARARFLDLLLSIIQNENRTILISSHILSDVEKVIDHVLMMKEGRILRDCPFDAMQEQYCRAKITALGEELPDPLPLRGVLECKREKNKAFVTLEGCPAAELEDTARTMRWEVETGGLTLEEIYAVVMR